MKLKVTNFLGTMPRYSATLLPPGAAQIANDCRMDTGSLSPLRQNGAVDTLAAEADSIVLHEGIWRGYTGHVDHARGPIAKERLYLTRENGVPLIYVGTTGTYDLRLDAPAAAPSVANSSAIVTDGSGEPDPPLEQVRYAYTYVTLLDEETAPSPLSDILLTQPEISVQLGNLVNPGVGRGVDRIRIYRSQTDVVGLTSLHFVREIAVTNPTHLHDPIAYPIGDVITTLTFSYAPDDLRGITSMPNGMMAGFSGQTLHFCEPYQPHAWPANYDLSTDYPIVALVSLGSTLVILTTGTPYIAQGTTPETLILEQVEENLPCLSAGSAVDLGRAAAYATHRGLVLVSASGVNVATRMLFTREQWNGLDPSSIRAGQIDGRYVFSYGPTGDRKTAIIDLTGDQPFVLDTSAVSRDLAYDITTGHLFMLAVNGTDILRFDDLDSPRRSMTWRSGRIQVDHFTTFGAVLVLADDLDGNAATLTTRIYADGALIREATDINDVFRLPAIRARTWEIEVQGIADVTSIAIAGSPEELIS